MKKYILYGFGVLFLLLIGNVAWQFYQVRDLNEEATSAYGELVNKSRSFVVSFLSGTSIQCDDSEMFTPAFRRNCSPNLISHSREQIASKYGLRKSEGTLAKEGQNYKASIGWPATRTASFTLLTQYEKFPECRESFMWIKSGSGPFRLHQFNVVCKAAN